MARSNNHFKAGLFIIISFGIALGIFFGITSSTLFNGPRNQYTAIFDLTDDVGGLESGSPVRLGGINVGDVEDVEIIELEGKPVVKSVFNVPTRYKLKKDALVSVQAGLTGTVNLNITSLGTSDQVATASDYLDGAPSGFAAAFELANKVGGEAVQTLQAWRPRVNGILDDARPRVNTTLDQFKTTAVTADDTIKHVKSKIDPAYDKYAGVADNASGAMSNLRDVLGDTKGDIRETMANLAATTGSLKEKIPPIMDKVASSLDGLRVSLDKTSGVLDDVKATVANTKDLSANVRSLIASNKSRLDEVIKSANLASQNLAAASSEIRRSPWRLLYKPSEGEVANQNLYDAARQFAEASRKLQDSSEALRDTLQDPNVKEEDVKKLLERLDIDFDDYKKVENALLERVK